MKTASPLPPATPPLKWAGGKRWLVPVLRNHFRLFQGARLVEPFCGGLAVTLGHSPQNALLNDINPHLLNFYRHLKKGLRMTIETRNDSTLYYSHRSRFNELIQEGQATSAEAAQLFYYTNRTGFNGLCRFNRSGFFNVPFGRYRTIHYRTDFLDYRPLFANWNFRCGDFEKLPLQPSDLIYADPPYDVQFTQYSAGGFSWDDQVRLAQWLTQHPGPVALSNQLTPRIAELYGDLGFTLKTLQAPRRIACTGDRTPAQEVLALRNF